MGAQHCGMFVDKDGKRRGQQHNTDLTLDPLPLLLICKHLYNTKRQINTIMDCVVWQWLAFLAKASQAELGLRYR